MAKQIVTTTEYTDDLDGSEAESTVVFGYDGTTYEIDLSRANIAALEDALALYVGHARKVRGSRRSATRGSSGRGRDVAAVRAWAAENGYDLAPRGRVPGEVLEAYDAAH
jgi:hypothetical protein